MQHSDDTTGGKRKETRLFNFWSRPATGKVLIVEPDPDIARMLEVRLAREGHEIIVADTGKNAVEIARQERFDVALIDRNLPDIGGLDILGQLRSIHKPFEGIVMSVDPTAEILVKALETGAFDLVVKPFTNLKIVTSKLRSAVEKVRAQRDRDELARMLAAQTADIVTREAEAERAGPQSSGSGDIDLDSELGSSLDLNGMSGIDPLTGLPNRRAADDRFRKETARALRYDRPLCIALGSIDALDAVIDRFGGAVADGVLRGIASIFSGMVRDVDFCARRQGGEFFFIFPETAKDSGFIVVDRIRQALSQMSFSEFVETKDDAAGPFKLTASFGIAGLPTDTMNADLLRDAAETALEQAKASGDRVVLFDSAMLRRV